jgi:TATA-binding protein-associated factor
METDQILDLFNLSSDADALPAPPGQIDAVVEEDAVDATGEVREKGKKGWLDDLGELWDDKQYEESFDLEGFLERMK